MKKLLVLSVLFFTTVTGYSVNIIFPTFNLYTEYTDTGNMWTSYLIDMQIDTGLKYGVLLDLGFKNHLVSSLESNSVQLDSIKLTSRPIDLLSLSFFVGRNMTLGKGDIGYQGFQFHQRTNLEYIGYKDIKGTGLEISYPFMDGSIEPHLMVYQPGITNTTTIDLVTFVKMESYIIEIYFGGNYNGTLPAEQMITKHFGFFVRTVFSKVDFLLGVYAPDSPLTNVPTADNFYFNATEHILLGYFEQTLSLFTRPSTYNGYNDTISNDFDFYFSAGARFDTWGLGAENTFTMAANYTVSDKVGFYFYYYQNSLQYKLGGYYTVLGNAYPSLYGAYLSVSGNL